MAPPPPRSRCCAGRHRHRLLVQARRSVDVQAAIGEWLGALEWPKSVRVAVDVDPYSFL
jgi:primosomal protein N' (replication factor Y)